MRSLFSLFISTNAWNALHSHKRLHNTRTRAHAPMQCNAIQCNAYTQLNTIHFVPKWRQYRNIFCICKLNVNQFNAPKNPQEHTLMREKTSCICASKLKITENIQHVLLSAFLILPMKHEFQSWLIHSCDYNRGNFMTKLGICFDLCYGSDFFAQ